LSADDQQQQDASKEARRSRFRDVSAITAIASLVVALIFNGLQVRDNATQASATRRATELQLLTQLNTLVAESQAKVRPESKEIEAAQREQGGLSERTRDDLAVVLKHMDYLAWLFNNHFVSIPGARQLWGQRMRCIYVTAVLLYEAAPIRARVENLARFADVPEHDSRRQLEALRGAEC
jgi:hypothetical protein